MIIKRARDFYIYTSNSDRYVDCNLSYGTAVLGHKALHTNTRIKTAMDNGMLGLYPSKETARSILHVQAFINNSTIKSDGEKNNLHTQHQTQHTWNIQAVLCANSYSISTHPYMVGLGIPHLYDSMMSSYDTAQDSDTKPTTQAILWRLFSDVSLDSVITSAASYLIIQAPIEYGLGIMLIYGKAPCTIPYIEVPPMVLAGINYIIPYLLEKGIRHRPISHVAKNRSDIYLVDTITTNARYQHTDIALSSTWKRHGVYVSMPQYTITEYQALYNTAWEHGFYLPPLYHVPCSTTDNKDIQVVPRFFTLPQYIGKHDLAKWNTFVACIKTKNL